MKNYIKAEKDYHKGMSYKDIAEKYSVSINTVKSWKTRYKWTKPNQPLKKGKTGAPYGNINAKGNKGNPNASGPPKGSQNALKHGFYSKYIPAETLEIMGLLDDGLTLVDLLWAQIQLQYAAIIRAQSIMYVKDKDDITRTITKIRETQNGTETELEVQQAWDKQANFLTAQSRAMAELRGLIKQFNDLAYEDDERRLKIQHMQLNIDKTKAEIEQLIGTGSEDSTVIVNDINEMQRVLDERNKDN